MVAKTVQEDGNVYTPAPPGEVSSFTQHRATRSFRSRLQRGLKPLSMLSECGGHFSVLEAAAGRPGEELEVMAGNKRFLKAGLPVFA